MNTLQTRIHTYRFDVSQPDQAEAYETLCQQLRQDGRHFFNVLAIPGHGEHKVNAGQITLETACVFPDQWNSDKGRVFDWYEGIYPNRKIKDGHYLEITEEMREVRRQTLKCGYCGKHYQAGDNPGQFCSACLDSEYLKESELFLLRLLPAGEHNPNRPALTDSELATLLPLYVQRQTTGNDSRAVQRKQKTRQAVIDKYTKNKSAVETEYRGFIWLLDHGVNTENCIYYSHTDKFSFWLASTSLRVREVCPFGCPDGVPFRVRDQGRERGLTVKDTKRYYVGVSRSGQRSVFRATPPVERDTHEDIYSVVIGPFRTRKAAYLMAEYGANNPHMQTVSDVEKLVRQNLIEFQTIYVASCWWRENDAFCTVAGNSARLVEKTIFKAMRNAAIDEYNNSDSEDKRRVRDFIDDIAWSGVNAFSFDSIIPERVISQYEDAYKTDADTVAHHPDMDYSDYEMLRDGRKDVVVYLPTC